MYSDRPDLRYSEHFILTTDASGIGIWAVLSQELLENDWPVVYMSKTLSKHQKNYSAMELEGPAVIMAVMQFLHYLYRPKVSDRRKPRTLGFHRIDQKFYEQT